MYTKLGGINSNKMPEQNKTLEELVTEIVDISAKVNQIDENPNHSYNQRIYLDNLLWAEDLNATASSYLRDVPYMNSFAKEAIDKRKKESKEIVKNNLKESISKFNEGALVHLALGLNESYQKVLAAKNNPSAIAELIKEYTENPKCLEYIKHSRDPHALENTYEAIVQIEQQKIANKEKFSKIENNKAVLDKNAVEAYIIKTIEAKDDAGKDKIYSKIVDLYCGKAE